jgi:methyltransferase-like protein/SAM-dependent methyltransferase
MPDADAGREIVSHWGVQAAIPMTDKTGENAYIYDQVPYPSLSFHVSHPDRLATLATLLGMRPPPVEHCRVLEIGCASGGNLIPIALGLPESEFVGIDLSAHEIAEGQSVLKAVGLKNVTLKHMNVLEVTPDFGQFDYIIAHGVYSWVPPDVQDKLLEICKQNLVPNGVAYVSYNTYPGWYMLIALREMMLWHARKVTDPMQQAADARALLEFLADSDPIGKNPHTSFMKAYVSYTKERIMPKTAAYLIHDELAEFNEPLYFYQFAERAAHHGLRYLAEAEFQTMLASNLPEDVAETLSQMAQDTITLEQYMDFLRNRTFRQTLLCHEEVPLTGSPPPDLLVEFYVGSPALPVESEPDIQSDAVEKFQASDGAVFSTDHPLSKAGMLYLSEIWPKSVPFKTVVTEAHARLNGASNDIGSDAQVLAASLLKAFGYSDNLVELRVSEPRFTLEISERPVASPVARYLTETGVLVTNLRHERIDLTGLAHRLLRYLDGSRDRADLMDIMKEWVAAGIIELKQDEEADENEEPQERDEESILAEMLDARLRQLANAALLVG